MTLPVHQYLVTKKYYYMVASTLNVMCQHVVYELLI